MSCPSVIGVGPYRPEIVDLLPYSRAEYSDTPEGTTIAGPVACWDVRRQGEAFLEIVGLRPGECWPGRQIPAITDDMLASAAVAEVDGTLHGAVRKIVELRRLQQRGWALFYEPDA